jgi:CubicO group peptidase (beta-lactamase class C family)
LLRGWAPRTSRTTFPTKRAPVTLRHILTHTSGIRHYRSTDFPEDPEFNNNHRRYHSLEEAIRIFKDDPLLFEPGAYYSYSSYATNLLQGVVETASGLGFEPYLRQRVWGPAGMASAALDLPERIVPHRARGYLVEGDSVTNYPSEDVTYKFAGGGMIGSAEDLVYFAHALNDGRLLEPETRALMWTPHVDPVLQFNGDDPPIPETRWKLGLMWRIRRDQRGREFVYEAGTVKGFNALLIDYYHEGVVAAVVGNGHPVAPAFREALTFAELFLEDPASAR